MVKRNNNRTGQNTGRTRNTDLVAKRVVIVVICLAIAVVGGFAAFVLLYDENEVVRGQLDELARAYYEEFTYPSLIKDGMSRAEKESLMEQYVERGFADVRLRQMIRRDGGKTVNDTSLIHKHCDENETVMRVYPEEPFDRKSYRIEYRYSCDFE